MSEKIIGYILLFLGIAVIAYSAISVISVFTGKDKPVELFNLGGISFDLQNIISANLPPEQKEQLAKSEIKTQQEIVKPEVFNTPLNYISHIVFMSFIAGIGFKIAKLGVMLVRPIKVKLKSAEITASPTK